MEPFFVRMTFTALFSHKSIQLLTANFHTKILKEIVMKIFIFCMLAEVIYSWSSSSSSSSIKQSCGLSIARHYFSGNEAVSNIEARLAIHSC